MNAHQAWIDGRQAWQQAYWLKFKENDDGEWGEEVLCTVAREELVLWQNNLPWSVTSSSPVATRTQRTPEGP